MVSSMMSPQSAWALGALVGGGGFCGLSQAVVALARP